MNKTCRCGRGYFSALDGLCGHCRTKQQAQAVTAYHLLRQTVDGSDRAVALALRNYRREMFGQATDFTEPKRGK